jgi:haloacetate dehalogenase
VEDLDWRSCPTARDGVRVAGWTAGSGEPVLLLHGYPQTSFMWRHLVPRLVAAGRSVVLADLRGYGASGPAHDGPVADPALYAKREMAADVVALLDSLGLDMLDVVGHDRGGRVAHRLALDHPARVRSIAVLDIVPTLHMFEHVDRAMAEAYFHWFFLTRPDGLPEALISAAPEVWLRSRFTHRHAGTPVEPAAVDVYLEAFLQPGVVAATCADYRAAATLDLHHDRADRDAGRRVTAPLLALWGDAGYVGRSFDVTQVWQQYADRVTGQGIDTDHYLAEEAPAEVAEVLLASWVGAR